MRTRGLFQLVELSDQSVDFTWVTSWSDRLNSWSTPVRPFTTMSYSSMRRSGQPLAGGDWSPADPPPAPVLARVADQVEGHVAPPPRRDERADLNEGAHPAALPLRVRPLEENLDVPRGALELLALPGPRDLA